MTLKSVYRTNGIRRTAAFLLLTALLTPAFRAASAEIDNPPADLTGRCAIALPEDSKAVAARLTDMRYNSRISFSKDESLEITLVNGAKGLYVAWYAAPEAARVEALDASGAVLESTAANPDLLNGYYPLPEGCVKARVAGDKPFAVSELRVYDSAAAPDDLCLMAAQTAQPKVMLILAHTGDESFDFGGVLPFLSGTDAAVVFLSSESRQAQQQAIEARYALGSRTQPVFARFPYYYDARLPLNKMYELVDKIELSNFLIQLLRRYQPDTLITHSAEGERGDGTHTLTAAYVLLAAEQAADATKEYVSERAYGVWQVGAVYQHMESGGSPLYDTHAPITAYGGKSAMELAQAGFERYTSFRLYHKSVTDTPYFLRTFPADPAVTEEQSGKQLYALLASLSGPGALPDAARIEPSATPETPAVTDEPVSTPVSVPAAASTGSGDHTIFALGAGLAALGVCITVFSLAAHFQSVEEGKKALRAVGTAVGVLFVICGVVLTLRANKQTQTPSPASTPSPAPAASAPAETATPTPTIDPLASHFRQEGEPAETVVFDYENGNFAYRSDTLGIEIRRVTLTSPPVVYYVAHIYERGEDSYRSGFGSERQNGRDLSTPVRWRADTAPCWG